jgi:hypothetical protein
MSVGVVDVTADNRASAARDTRTTNTRQGICKAEDEKVIAIGCAASAFNPESCTAYPALWQ